MKGIIIAVIGLIAGPVLTVGGLKEKAMLDRIAKEGVEVDGIPTEGESKSSRRSKSYKVTVIYPVQGEPVKKEFKVKKAFFETLGSNGTITRDTVKVKYVPADPQMAILPEGSEDEMFMLYMGPVFFLGGLGYLIYRAKAKKTAVA